eukprot:TRINITY_DN11391_c0_g1_i1.p1 TRINITY_DN11391_c0_g1~~TRINITY_DN11391_c0_g1_i1.p1  ORF type:complete len:187 (+),score=22.86 TRINITY_DN11391_c0_g1_i1:81-563(+)
MGKEDPLDMALPDDEASGDDYDRDEDFDGDYRKGCGLELKGTEELAMDYAVFGRYVQSGSENGKPKYLGPKTEGCRPAIAFVVGGDGKPTWWVYDASGGECFYAESNDDLPPRTGWRKEYADEDLEVTLEGGAEPGKQSSACPDADRPRSRSPRREKCPW